MTASYVGAAEAIVAESVIRANITKTLTPVSGNTIAQSDMVKVTIDIEYYDDAPDGTYTLTDYIPSGMRLVRVDTYANSWLYDSKTWYLSNQEKQQLIFVNHNKAVQLEYYLQAILPGEFVVDSAHLQHDSTAARGSSVAGTVIVDPR